jgi:hypothetical protein
VGQIVIEKAKGEYFLPVELNGSAQQVIAKCHAVNMFPGLVHNGQSISGFLPTVQPCAPAFLFIFNSRREAKVKAMTNIHMIATRVVCRKCGFML